MPKRKKLALALSGCGGRAVVYIGMLEVFQENEIPVDMIAATSSATFIACAFACGNLEALKEKYFSLTRKELFDMFEPSFKGGMFSLGGVDVEANKFITVDNLEDLKIPVSIVASDIVHGEEVIFSVGNIMRAIKASCSMPGLFEPVVWGNRVLIDGGLFNIIPVEAAKVWGADVVVGVDMARARDLFSNRALQLRRGYNFVRKPVVYLKKISQRVVEYAFGQSEPIDHGINSLKTPGMLAVLGKALDYAIYERRKNEVINCHVIIRPDIKDYGDIDIEKRQSMYLEGRRAAELAVPAIKKFLQT
jgi:predicted acylesterase/phospholipase RssA